MDQVSADKKVATILLVRGLPGSGKTYVSAALRDAIGAECVVMLDPDATDYTSKEYTAHTQALTLEGVDQALHAYRFLRAQAYQGIAEGKVIIWNQPFTNLEIFHKMVANFQIQAEASGVDMQLLVVEVELNPEAAKLRVATRKEQGGHGPSDSTFARFTNDYHTFANDGYQTVTVYGDADVQDSVNTVLKAMQDLRSK